MIRVRVASLDAVEAEALLRPVNSNLLAVSAAGRAVEVGAGAPVRTRLESMGDLPVGGAVVTPAGELGADFLIHAVVQSSDEPVTQAGIRNALLNGLRRASEWEMRSLALPLLGTGAGNLDPDVAAEIMILVLREHLESHELPDAVTVVVANGYEEEIVLGVLERAAEADEVGRRAAGNGNALGEREGPEGTETRVPGEAGEEGDPGGREEP
ncbi:MAG: hypothetical protein GWM92_02850 [Gemmatimonadetes bacterium]|nr:hypothetical protein [Gemmatimonadota bacterium]NIR77437.1 hypothetical protein [Gemmatimonadota bacterium]NIT85961.1 hypothetical protein [Gemmatimonadota bacterium]NIU29781.1 hypothetical protein [Gemmatimonadota bacterium]NIU34803.1 hypothetical protein [Gemmatimonadota bacterium]